MARFGSAIAAILASTALSPSAWSARAGRAAAFFAACLWCSCCFGYDQPYLFCK